MMQQIYPTDTTSLISTYRL